MATRQEAFNTAVTWIAQGPYTWGGNSRTGNDCSGFIDGVLREVGAPFPYRDTAEGIRQWCTPIPRDQAEPGDLVFFENTDPDIWNRESPGPDGKIASHIGFVDVDWPKWILDSHERSPTQGVNYTDITNSYWAPKVIETRRIPQLEESSAGNVPADQEAALEEWYRGYIANLIGPEGELQKAVDGILKNTKVGSNAHTLTKALADRLDTLWKEYNG